MRTPLFLSLLLCTIGVQAQNCKYTENKYDPFLKAYRVATKAKLAIDMTSGANFYFRRVDSTYIIGADLSLGATVIGHDDPIMFRLSNDTVVEMTTGEVYAAESVVSGGMVFQVTHPNYRTTRSQLEQVARSSIVGVRVYYSDAYAEYDLGNKPNLQEKMRKAIGCLLEAKPE